MDSSVIFARGLNERDRQIHLPPVPTDYEIFLAKSQADYERCRERNWATIRIDDESLVSKETVRQNDGQPLRSIRICLRVAQGLIRSLPFCQKLIIAR